MGAQYDRKQLGIMLTAIRRRFPLTPEQCQDFVNIVHNLALHGGEERTQLKACQVAVAMDNANLKDEFHEQAREERQTSPSLVVNGDVNLTVSRDAVLAMLQARKELSERITIVEQKPPTLRDTSTGAVVATSSETPLPTPPTPSPIPILDRKSQIGLKEISQNETA